MTKTEITTKEKALLKEYLRESPLILIRLKCQALLMRQKGLKLADIGDIVSKDEQTISRWIKDWNKARMASIFTGQKDNENASKLTKAQKEETKKALASRQAPTAYRKTFGMCPL